ncbi:MAG TPA: PAS domain-containing protein [Candidatus Limnocylindrales bacterium]|nr:PAS domain-containing protein [Candidatus Limnocylindrales bacterium]
MGSLPQGRLTAAELSLGRAILEALPAFGSSSTPTAVALVDGRILLVNDACVRLTGYARDELLGVPAMSLVTPRLVPGTVALRDRILAEAGGGEGSPDETYHTTQVLATRSGREIVVRASITLLRSRDGTPRAFLNRLVEVTHEDRQLAPWTQRLGEADAELLASALAQLPAFDHLPEPSTIVSAQGLLLQVNRAFEAAFGWTNSDVVGIPAADLLASDQRTWAEQRLEAIVAAELLPTPSQPRIRHRDGHSVTVTATSIPVRTPDGTTRYIIGTLIPT